MSAARFYDLMSRYANPKQEGLRVSAMAPGPDAVSSLLYAGYTPDTPAEASQCFVGLALVSERGRPERLRLIEGQGSTDYTRVTCYDPRNVAWQYGYRIVSPLQENITFAPQGIGYACRIGSVLLTPLLIASTEHPQEPATMTISTLDCRVLNQVS